MSLTRCCDSLLLLDEIRWWGLAITARLGLRSRLALQRNALQTIFETGPTSYYRKSPHPPDEDFCAKISALRLGRPWRTMPNQD